jgi:hypothetical protein
VAEEPRVGVVVPNPFLHIPVVAAVRAGGARALDLPDPGSAAAAGCAVVIVDLDALGPDPAPAIRAATAGGAAVLGFAPHARGDRLEAARAAGATALPRSLFLQRLPELLAALLDRGDGKA